MKFVNGHIRMDPTRSVNFKTDPELYEAAKEILSIAIFKREDGDDAEE